MSHLTFRCSHRYASGFWLEAAFETAAEVTAVFGPSGSGKSSVLSLIAGLLRPERGEIRLGDRVLLDTAKRVCLPPEQRRVGLVFQDQRLFPHLSVKGNLTYGLHRRPTRRLDVQHVIDTLELGELLHRSPQTLSGGQKQRVALGRAILRGPELLLMDEPLTALDLELKGRILDYLQRLITEFHIPTLFVSHDPEDVRRLAQTVIVLESGRVTAVGPVSERLV